VHGKGKKDRTVPIPETITQDLKAQIERVAKQHDLYPLRSGQNGQRAKKPSGFMNLSVP